jgi:hypothetical protein
VEGSDTVGSNCSNTSTLPVLFLFLDSPRTPQHSLTVGFLVLSVVLLLVLAKSLLQDSCMAVEDTVCTNHLLGRAGFAVIS